MRQPFYFIFFQTNWFYWFYFFLNNDRFGQYNLTTLKASSYDFFLLFGTFVLSFLNSSNVSFYVRFVHFLVTYICPIVIISVFANIIIFCLVALETTLFSTHRSDIVVVQHSTYYLYMKLKGQNGILYILKTFHFYFKN